MANWYTLPQWRFRRLIDDNNQEKPGGETMILKDIRDKARSLGVKNYSKLSKGNLIRAIQEKEGNSPCYQNIYDCRQDDCLWRPDCQG
jgi:hypothetical protein